MESEELLIDAGIKVVADKCRKSFFYFIKQFWGTIIKESPVYNWHIEYLCSELETVAMQLINRQPKLYDLIINIPPGTTKSTITTIMLPAWIWTNDATIRIITNSYSNDLAIEHAVKSRDIIFSDKYKRLFPEVEIRRDKSAKGSFENTQTGARYATSTGGTITGIHAHIIINDDPLNPSQSASDAERNTANEHTKTLSSRKVDKENTPIITIMQRLHEMDVTGYLLSKKGENIKHICLPAEVCEAVKPYDLKTRYMNGLLDPVRLNRAILSEAKVDLGSRMYAGQYDQAPVIPGGNIIKQAWFQYVTKDDYSRMNVKSPVIFFVDTAYTENENNDPTGIIATQYHDNKLFITHGKKVYMEFPDLVKFLPQYCIENGYSNSSTIRIEPKANGLSVIQQLKEITNLNIIPTDTPKDSKETRLNSISPKIESERVFLVAGAWNGELVGEICGFPGKPHDEYVDLLCYAVDYHLKKSTKQYLDGVFF